MTTILTEETESGLLTFEFSDKWQVCKYDKQPFYTTIGNKGLKGVDFIALSSKGLLLMEVKYVTTTNKKSKLRFTVDSDKIKLENIKAVLSPNQQKKIIIDSARPYLADEVSKKIKDTLLVLLANHRNKESTLSFYSESLFTCNNQPILVLLFLERNTQLNQEWIFKPLASNLKLAIEQKLSFLGNIQVDIVNTLTLPPALEIKILENIPSSSL